MEMIFIKLSFSEEIKNDVIHLHLVELEVLHTVNIIYLVMYCSQNHSAKHSITGTCVVL